MDEIRRRRWRLCGGLGVWRLVCRRRQEGCGAEGDAGDAALPMRMHLGAGVAWGRGDRRMRMG